MNVLPPEKPSVFKTLVRSQDEVPGSLCKTFFLGNSKDKFPDHYIRQTSINSSQAYCPSVFHSSNSATKLLNRERKEVRQQPSDAVFYLLVFCLITGVIIYVVKHKRLSQVFKSFYMPYFTNQLVREGLIQKEFFSLPLLLVYYTSLAMLITKGLGYFFGLSTDIRFILFITGVMLCLALIKNLLIAITKWAFKTRKETSEYNTNNFIFSIVTGMFLVPMVFIIYYVQEPYVAYFLYFTLAITALLLLYRTFRSFLTGFSSEGYSLYYFILYLCTIEILPPLIIVKLLINYHIKGVFIV